MDGTVSVFPGWMYQQFLCAVCGTKWIGVAAIGIRGLQCPGCGRQEPDYVWYPAQDDPGRPNMAHDGCWLTGELDLPELWPDDEEEYTVDFPWYVKALAFFLTLTRLLRHRS